MAEPLEKEATLESLEYEIRELEREQSILNSKLSSIQASLGVKIDEPEYAVRAYPDTVLGKLAARVQTVRTDMGNVCSVRIKSIQDELGNPNKPKPESTSTTSGYRK